MTTVTSTTFIDYALDVLYPELFQNHAQQLETTFETISKEFHEGLKEIKHARDDYRQTKSLLETVIPGIEEIFHQSILEPVKSETLDVLESKLGLLEKALSIKHQQANHVITQVQLTAEICYDQVQALKEKQNNLLNLINNVHQVHEIFKDQESHEAEISKQAEDQRLKIHQQRVSQKQQRRKHEQELKIKQNEIDIKKRQMEEKAQLAREEFEQKKIRTEKSFQLKKQQLNERIKLYAPMKRVKNRRPK